VSQALCIETFKDFDIFGRFMLRDEGITVGMGIVKKLHDIVATA
jgi:translation elongation factor EF-1alpha